jgi:hypothetical protein
MEATTVVDARIHDAGGGLYLVEPVTEAAREWIAEHVGEGSDVLWWAGALVVEHRYIAELVSGMAEELAVMCGDWWIISAEDDPATRARDVEILDTEGLGA